MGIRGKLLLILLVVALPPMIIVSLLNGMAVRHAGAKLVEEQLAASRAALVQTVTTTLAVHAAGLRHRRVYLEDRLGLWAALLEGRIDLPSEALTPGAGIRLGARRADGRTVGQWRATDQTLGEDLPATGIHWRWQAGEVIALRRFGLVDGRYGVAVLALSEQRLLEGLAVPDFLSERISTHVLPLTDGDLVATKTAAEGSDKGEALDHLGGRRTGHQWTSWRGELVLLAHDQTGGFPARVALIVPESVLTESAHFTEQGTMELFVRLQTIGIATLVVFSVAAVVLAIIGARFFVGPIQSLIVAVRRVAAGNLDTRVTIRTGDQFQELGERFNQMVPQLGDRMRMHRAMELAVEVQQHLLPKESPTLAGFDIHGTVVYHDATGGDYFDFLDIANLDGKCLGVAVGDVTGHGIAAALIMATARALLRGQVEQAGHLSEMMNRVNRNLAGDAIGGRFMTLFYGILNENSGDLRWVNAGHNPGILYHSGHDRFIDVGGEDIPLGIDAHWKYREHRRTLLLPGSVLVLATDGILEARNPQGDMMGVERLKELIRRHHDQPARRLTALLAEGVADYRGGQPLDDDATLVVIKRVQPPSASPNS